MKVLIQFGTPFFLVHGGAQTQIEQTKKSLEAIDVEVEWVRWWAVGLVFRRRKEKRPLELSPF